MRLHRDYISSLRYRSRGHTFRFDSSKLSITQIGTGTLTFTNPQQRDVLLYGRRGYRYETNYSIGFLAVLMD